ncbi:hypothetical protein [Paenibacillus sp. FSL M8-0142]|uniref:hypothetical protein n=1 Tax=Paenibacillus sp. FSL M8-0142 TaxID=2954525 RepID=UPI003159BAB4
MSESATVTFRRTDLVGKDMVDVAKEIADHFKVKRDYFRQFTRIIQVSKRWRILNLDQSLSEWITRFGSLGGRTKIIGLVQRGFGLCQTDKDIDELRGILVEALLIAAYGGSKILNETRYGWGAKVYIQKGTGQTQVVKYQCRLNKEDGCEDRHTVDFGIWDGYHGKFFECKANPISIGCKEVSYMNHLRDVMGKNGLSHETFFVCPEDKDSIEMRLKELECSVLLKPIGVEELERMIAC